MLRAQTDAGANDLHSWLADRKNRRVVPHRLASCGYMPVPSSSAGRAVAHQWQTTDDLWAARPRAGVTVCRGGRAEERLEASRARASHQRDAAEEALMTGGQRADH